MRAYDGLASPWRHRELSGDRSPGRERDGHHGTLHGVCRLVCPPPAGGGESAEDSSVAIVSVSQSISGDFPGNFEK